jgi:hypothetical protein
MSRFSKGAALCALLLLMASVASADSLVGLSSSGSLSDQFNWSQLGGDGTVLNQTFGVTSNLGLAGAVGLQGPNSIVAVQCPAASCSWTGNFNAGDSLVWTSDGNGQNNGPLAMGFGSGVNGVGAFIQEDIPGQFTARISIYSGATLLGSYSVTSDGAGDVVYVGLEDLSGYNITSAVFDLTNCAGFDCSVNDFAIDGVEVNTPEPGSLALLGSGLVGLAGIIRRRL